MHTLDSLPELCTADEAVTCIAALLPALGIDQQCPDIRTLRLWRTKKSMTIESRYFTRRNLLEVLHLLNLRQDGLAHQNAVKRTLAMDEGQLKEALIRQNESSDLHTDAEAVVTLQLLTKGILEQYRRVVEGAVVGHTDHKATRIVNTPVSLHQAMAHLGRLYFHEGSEDRAASIHQLLRLCMEPLVNWAPKAIGGIERYRDAVLIDPIYRVPNEDCETIAQEAQGANLSDLTEHYLHEALRNTLNQLGSQSEVAYTTIREFVGRHPLATAEELQQCYRNPELNNNSIEFVRNLYRPVHASHATEGQVRRCFHCKGLVSSENLCVMAGCREDFPDVEVVEPLLPLSQAYLARPEVLKYWADPAREELRLYDVLCAEEKLCQKVYLYPHSDWCDVSIAEDVGVDVKDYRDPARLAQRLNRSLGNLVHYSERIIAIARRRWSPTYRDRLVEQLLPERRAELRIMSVDQAIAHIQESFGGGSHAGKA